METVQGTPVAGPPGMVRRAFAMIAIVILLGLAFALMWRVYLHHQRSIAEPDEPALVKYQSQASLFGMPSAVVGV